MKKQTKLNKVGAALEDIFYNGNLKKYHLTLQEAQTVWDGVAAILKYGSTTTISVSVKNFFEKYEFCVETEGIGWKISL